MRVCADLPPAYSVVAGSPFFDFDPVSLAFRSHGGRLLASLLYSGLFSRGSDGRVRAALAATAAHTSDFRLWSVSLSPAAPPAHVVAQRLSFLLVPRGALRSTSLPPFSALPYYAGVLLCEADGPRSLRFTSGRPVFDLPYLLSHAAFRIPLSPVDDASGFPGDGPFALVPAGSDRLSFVRRTASARVAAAPGFDLFPSRFLGDPWQRLRHGSVDAALGVQHAVRGGAAGIRLLPSVDAQRQVAFAFNPDLVPGWLLADLKRLLDRSWFQPLCDPVPSSPANDSPPGVLPAACAASVPYEGSRSGPFRTERPLDRISAFRPAAPLSIGGGSHPVPLRFARRLRAAFEAVGVPAEVVLPPYDALPAVRSLLVTASHDPAMTLVRLCGAFEHGSALGWSDPDMVTRVQNLFSVLEPRRYEAALCRVVDVFRDRAPFLMPVLCAHADAVSDRLAGVPSSGILPFGADDFVDSVHRS